jgi:hypothetical protein
VAKEIYTAVEVAWGIAWLVGGSRVPGRG